MSKVWKKRLLRNRFKTIPTNTVLRIRRKMRPIRNTEIARRKRVRRRTFTPILLQQDFNQDFQLNWA